MSDDAAAALERIRAITARAAQAAAGEAIAPDPRPTPSPSGDRPADAKPERAAPRHWQEAAEDRDQDEET